MVLQDYETITHCILIRGSCQQFVLRRLAVCYQLSVCLSVCYHLCPVSYLPVRSLQAVYERHSAPVIPAVNTSRTGLG